MLDLDVGPLRQKGEEEGEGTQQPHLLELGARCRGIMGCLHHGCESAAPLLL